MHEASLLACEEGEAGHAKGLRQEECVGCGGTARGPVEGELGGEAGEARPGTDSEPWRKDPTLLGSKALLRRPAAGPGWEAPGTGGAVGPLGQLSHLEHKVKGRFCVGSQRERLGLSGVNLEISWTKLTGLEDTL